MISLEKKTFELAYGRAQLAISLPRQNLLGLLSGKRVANLPDVRAAVRRVLSQPIGSPPLVDIVRRGEKVAIIGGDITRVWVHYDLLIPPILDTLNQRGISDDDITVIIGQGTHRSLTREEVLTVYGAEVAARVRIEGHDCLDRANLVNLGKTVRGTPIELNKKVVESDRVIVTGGIVYHFLAGFGGGKKGIMPGIAGFDTVQTNHALFFNPPPARGMNLSVGSGCLKGNPLSADMVEIARHAHPDFLVNVVVNGQHQLSHIVGGDLIAAHLAGCQFVREHFSAPLDERAELVIVSCGGWPKDINLYQAYKTLDNAVRAVRPGGVIVLLAECSQGLGGAEFEEIFTSPDSLEEKEDRLRAYCTIGGAMAYGFCVQAKAHTVILVSELLDEQVRVSGTIPAHSVDEALSMAYHLLGMDTPITYLMPQGSITFPILSTEMTEPWL